jgi:hypothetical protein
MKSPDGYTFQCVLPNIVKKSNNVSERIQFPDVSIFDVYDNRCFSLRTSYWNYEFCFNNYVKQYHYSDNPRDKSHEYFLGYYDQTTPITIKQGLKTVALVKNGEINVTSEIVDHLPFRVIYTYRHGTKCDLTNKDRKIQVVFECLSNNYLSSGAKLLLNKNDPEFMVSVKETGTCEYTLIMSSQRLCLAKKEMVSSNVIECLRFITKEEFETLKNAKENKGSNSNAKENKQKENFKSKEDGKNVKTIRKIFDTSLNAEEMQRLIKETEDALKRSNGKLDSASIEALREQVAKEVSKLLEEQEEENRKNKGHFEL